MPMALLLVSGHRADIPSLQSAHKLADLGITAVTVPAEAVLPTLQPLILETQFHVAVRCGSAGG